MAASTNEAAPRATMSARLVVSLLLAAALIATTTINDSHQNPVYESSSANYKPPKSTNVITDSSESSYSSASSNTQADNNNNNQYGSSYQTDGDSPTVSRNRKPAQSSLRTTSTTTPAYAEEERLLISINTQDSDNIDRGFDSNNNSPLTGSSSSSNNRLPSVSQLQSSYDSDNIGASSSSSSIGNRKPAQQIVTIAIQTDSGHNNRHREQLGQSGSSQIPALIVRPSDSGSAIAIITTSSSSGSSSGIHSRPPVTGGLTGNHQRPVSVSSSGSSDYEPYPRPPSPVHSSGSQQRPSVLSGGSIGQPQHHQRPSSSSVHGTGTHVLPPVNEPNDNNYSRPPPISSTNSLLNDNNAHSSQNPRPPGGASGHSGGASGHSGSQHQQSADDIGRPKLNEPTCGMLYDTRIVGGEEADPDYFQWMAAIIRSRPTNGEAKPFCGGSLITNRHVLTAAHCLEGLAPRDVLIRLGSYDFDDSASSTSPDYAVDQFRVPAEYSKKTHSGDIAIMRLKTPLSAQETYKTVCMPLPRRSYVGVIGTVIGYGSQSQTFRKATPKLRQVSVPVWENRKCSQVYKKNITDSFLCAGYEEGGKDACQGDSGGPLMSDGPNQRLMIIGVVSHGIGCGSPGYPGVYTRTSHYLDWIEKNTRE